MHYRLYGAIATALASAAAFAQTTSLHRIAGFGGDTTSASILNGGASFGTSMRVINGSMKGQRAYIATALGTSEVGTLSISSTGQGSSGIRFYNGTIATGVYQVYGGSTAQIRAFRYVAGSQTSEDLGDFGVQGTSLSPAVTLINAVRGSEIIGAMSKHTSVANLGLRAFRSYADGSLVDLGTLGTTSTGAGSSMAHVFSNDGSTVYGVSTKYVGGVNQGSKAFYAVAGEQMRELATPTASLSISGRVKVLANGKIAAASTNGRLIVWAGNDSSSALEQTIGTGAIISLTDSASNMYVLTGSSSTLFSSWVVGDQSLTPLRIGSSTSSVRVTAVGNAAGRVVGESVNTPQQTVAFRFSLMNGYEELGHLGATSSGLSYSSAKLELDNGLVVGDSRLGNFGMRGFYWESGVGMQSIGTLGTDTAGNGFSTISGKLNFNQVYGQSDLYLNGVAQGRRAIVWSKFAGLRYVGDLFSADDSAGWVFTLITGASADGWVTGYGVKDGIRQAYRFQMQFMTPEPSTMIGLAVGGLALLRRKRK